MAPGEQFPPVNPSRSKLHLQVQGLMLLFQCSLWSKALLSKQNTWTKSCLVLQRTGPAARTQSHTGALQDLLYRQDSISHGVTNVLSGSRIIRSKITTVAQIKMLKSKYFSCLGRRNIPSPPPPPSRSPVTVAGCASAP